MINSNIKILFCVCAAGCGENHHGTINVARAAAGEVKIRNGAAYRAGVDVGMSVLSFIVIIGSGIDPVMLSNLLGNANFPISRTTFIDA